MLYRIYGYKDKWKHVRTIKDKGLLDCLIKYYELDYSEIIVVEHNVLLDSDTTIYDTYINRKNDVYERKRNLSKL